MVGGLYERRGCISQVFVRFKKEIFGEGRVIGHFGIEYDVGRAGTCGKRFAGREASRANKNKGKAFHEDLLLFVVFRPVEAVDVESQRVGTEGLGSAGGIDHDGEDSGMV